MDIISAYRDAGTYRGAAEICGTTHKTVRRVIAAHVAASSGAPAPTIVVMRTSGMHESAAGPGGTSGPRATSP